MVRMEKRPTTATLIKPTVLDARLLGIFDMTTVSREHLLAIKNLVHSTPRCKCKSTISIMEAFAIDCNSAKVHADEEDDNDKNNNNNNNNNFKNIRVQKARKELNKTYRISRHRERANLPDAEELSQASSEERKPKVPCIPIPCVTCGRQNQPERFHSHPSRRQQVKTKEISSTVIRAADERKTVQKPVPIKFRSVAKNKSNSDTKETPPPASKNDGGRRGRFAPHHAKPKERKSAKNSDVIIAADDGPSVDRPSGKENAKVKTNWKEATRKITLQQPKHNNDDSGKVKANDFSKTPSYDAYKLDTWVPAPVSGERKRKVVCSLCSQEFGTTLLPSHEAQCIQQYLGVIDDNGCNGATKNEKDEIENQKEILSAQAKENWKLAWELTQTVLIACKCCGRKFLPSRVEAHQKICSLKSNNHCRLRATRPFKLDVTSCESSNKWSSTQMIPQIKESAKLEYSQQKNQSPLTLPQSMFNTNSVGQMVKAEINSSQNEKEHEGAEHNIVEVFWKAHQAQLVPCTKCARTFHPHRLEVHMRGCKETSIHHERKPAKVNVR